MRLAIWQSGRCRRWRRPLRQAKIRKDQAGPPRPEPLDGFRLIPSLDDLVPLRLEGKAERPVR